MELIIVESPKKAKTISSFLKKGVKVIASKGHVIDLPKSKLGVEVENNFEPVFQPIKGKEAVLNDLKKNCKGVKKVYLATDPDREGEAIAYHLKLFLEQELKGLEIKRLAFHEITKSEIVKAMENPGEIDMYLVDAQITRRVIDRLMGYSLSPFLWKTLSNYKLSAGRVQSIALRFICEREEEIDRFVPTTYYDVRAAFEKDGMPFEAILSKWGEVKPPFEDKKQVEAWLKNLNKEFLVTSITTRESKLAPKPPFTTSALQREAFNLYKYSSSKTMQIAQKLYEGVELKEGTTGLITYMRTDSVRVSEEAIAQNREFLQTYYPQYLEGEVRHFANKKNQKIQDAHEAIRPSNVYLTPKDVKDYLAADEYKLYSLIWKRFVATQMKEAVYENAKIKLATGDGVWDVSGKIRTYDGFEKITGNKTKDMILPQFKEQEKLLAKKITNTEKQTPPPPRYTEASMIGKMEKTGVGRPSTYAPTLKLLLSRDYVERDNNSLKPTPMGKVVNRILVENFDQLVREDFTAEMEDQLDKIETHDMTRFSVVKGFYESLNQGISVAEGKINEEEKRGDYRNFLKSEKEKVKVVKDEPCPLCGKEILLRKGRFGQFWGCSGYPECKHVESLRVVKDEPCPKCGKALLKKKGKFGNFWGCEGYPDCNHMEPVRRGRKKQGEEEGAESQD